MKSLWIFFSKKYGLQKIFVCMVLAISLCFSNVTHADDNNELDISVDFENIDDLSIAYWTIKNLSKVPIRPGTMIADYACGDGFVERVEHVFRVTISPDSTYKDEGAFVCAGREKALSYRVIGNNEEIPTRIAGNEIFYQLQCGDGTKVFVILKWNSRGYYEYETPNNYKNILTKEAVEDNSFAELTCNPSPPPTGSIILDIKEWVRKQVLSREGDPKKGYYVTPTSGGLGVGG